MRFPQGVPIFPERLLHAMLANNLQDFATQCDTYANLLPTEQLILHHASQGTFAFNPHAIQAITDRKGTVRRENREWCTITPLELACQLAFCDFISPSYSLDCVQLVDHLLLCGCPWEAMWTQELDDRRQTILHKLETSNDILIPPLWDIVCSYFTALVLVCADDSKKRKRDITNF